MYALLKTSVEEPLQPPGLSTAVNTVPLTKPEITQHLRRKLLTMHLTSYDWEQGGLKIPIKFIDRDSLEYSLVQAAGHDRNEERMAQITLENSLKLIDPIFGGIYQYSTRGCWDHPHYAKTMAAQAGCLRIYSLAYALLHEHRYLMAARSIRDYLREYLLSPEGAFYTGQSDQVAGINPVTYFSSVKDDRIRYGIPAIDNHLYTRENAWAIEALATFYEFTGEHSALTMATRALNWILAERSIAENGFRHGENDAAGPFLDDNLAVARALLQLYRVTADSRYLQHAEKTVEFIALHFTCCDGGFNAAVQHNKSDNISPRIDENICATRFLNLLIHYTNDSTHRKLATHGLRHLSVSQFATARMEEAGILLVDEEYSTQPLKITVIGNKTDTCARKLHETAMRAFGWYKVLQWVESDSPVVRRFDIDFPTTNRARAFISNEYYQSGPVTEPAKLAWLIKRT